VGPDEVIALEARPGSPPKIKSDRCITNSARETFCIGLPQQDRDKRRGIDDHSALHAGSIVADDLVRAAGIDIRLCRTMPVDLHQAVGLLVLGLNAMLPFVYNIA
jgi:hypothetical protein